MDAFLAFGANKACQVLFYVSQSSYHETCEGYANANAYVRAGWMFWGSVALALVLSIMLGRSIARFID